MAARIEEELRNFIAEAILFSENGYPYADDASFLENGVVDSMSIMELVLFADERFGVHIREDEIIPENFDSISQLSNFIRLKIDASS